MTTRDSSGPAREHPGAPGPVGMAGAPSAEAQRDVAEVRRALATLQRAVGGLQARHAETLGIRRLVSDVRRLTDDLEELGELRPVHHTGDRLPRLEFVPDRPYEPDFWRDADDEGIGGTH